MSKTTKKINFANLNDYPRWFRNFYNNCSFPYRKPMIATKRERGMTSSGIAGSCHWNVIGMVKEYGGKVVMGYILTKQEDCTGEVVSIKLVGHSVWLSPEGELVELTNHSDSDTIFIPIHMSNIYDKPRNIDFHNTIVRSSGEIRTFSTGGSLDVTSYIQSFKKGNFRNFLGLKTFTNDEKLSLYTAYFTDMENPPEWGFKKPSTATGRTWEETVEFRSQFAA